MAATAISQWNQFPCKTTLSINRPSSQLFTSRPSIVASNSARTINSIFTSSSFASRRQSVETRPLVLVRAVKDDDEWGPEKEEEGAAAVAVVEEEKKEEELTAIYSLKKQLVDSFYGTDRGLNATSETRAEIVELITQLEARNPTPAPTDALPLLNGKWILVSSHQFRQSSKVKSHKNLDG